MVVETVFKGQLKSGDRMTFSQGQGADCVMAFDDKEIDKRFLFYLNAGNQPYTPSICGRSNSVEAAADDLLYLQNIEKLRGRTRISGTLSFRNGPGVALAGRKLTLVGDKTYVVETDKNGVYELYDVPPGRYFVSPDTIPGWKIVPFYHRYSPSFVGDRRADYTAEIPIQIDAGQHAALDLHFELDNGVTGQIVDPSGQPMKDVCVELRPIKKVESIDFDDFDCSDADGAFSIDSVPPGSYVLAVNRENIVTSEEPFHTFYYPAAKEPQAATPITIRGSEHIDLRVRVPEVQDTVVVRGRLRYSDDKPVVDGSIEFEADRSNKSTVASARAVTGPQGRFSIRILKGWSGKLYGSMFTYVGKFRNCPQLDAIARRPAGSAELKTTAVVITAQTDLDNVELRFPYAGCEPASR